MKLIVGLGNIGDKHQKNRHNLGFMVVEQFLKNFEPIEKTSWENSDKFKSDIAKLEWKPKQGPLTTVVLVKPRTFMNNSGMVVKLTTSFYKLSPDDVWIVHDDIDLPLGSIRIRNGGSAAGHRGIETILKELGTEKFWRFRLGVGHPRNKTLDGDHKTYIRDVDSFVLGDFAGDEKGKVKELIKHSAKAMAHALETDLASAMNKFNTK